MFRCLQVNIHRLLFTIMIWSLYTVKYLINTSMANNYKQRQMVQKKKKYRNIIIIKINYVITTLNNIQN